MPNTILLKEDNVVIIATPGNTTVVTKEGRNVIVTGGHYLGIGEAPRDGEQYGRLDGLWSKVSENPAVVLNTAKDGTSHADVLVDGDIGGTVQGHSTVLDNTTASFLTADKTKLNGIEAGAKADQIASEVPSTPAGELASTDVQGALNELDTEKANRANANLTGTTSANALKLSTSPTGVPTTEGTLSHDPTTHTPSYKSDIAGTTLNIGLEDWTRIKNSTGSDIGNAKVIVGVSVPAAKVFNVELALATPTGPIGIIGITTNAMTIGNEGWATTRGYVDGVNTIGGAELWSAFDPLYVSSTVAGELTNVPPIPPSYAIPVGFVSVVHATEGEIYVFATNPDMIIASTNASVASGDPTGWHDGNNIVVEYDSTARTITLTGDLKYSWRGQVKELTSPWVSDAHSSTLDNKYFLSTSDGVNFGWSTSVWAFTDIMVAMAYYYTTDKGALREAHGLMPWQAHEEFHKVIHTYRESGGTLSDYTLASTVLAERRPTVTSAIIKDEDCRTTLPEISTASYTNAYLSGTGDATFAKAAVDIVPLSVAQPYWNQFVSPNWVQTLLTNNSYMCVWLVAMPATADAGSQPYRYMWVQGQHAGTLLEQIALAPSDVSLGSLSDVFTEFVFCTKIIVRYTAGDWHINSVYNLTGTSASNVGSPAGVFLSSVTSDITLSGDGTVTSPLGVDVTKTGATQILAGAVAGEFWITASHATLPDNVVMIGA